MNMIRSSVFGMAATVVAMTLPMPVSAHDIVIGAAVSATGKYAVNGKHTTNGYNLAVSTVNAMGGITIDGKSHNIVVKYYDDESTAARGTQLAERLIQQDGVKLMLGPYSSGMTKAIAPVTEKYKIPMVEANGASRSLFNKGYKYLFAVLSTSEQYLKSAIDLAAAQAKMDGKKASDVRIAVAVRNDPFSLDIRAGILEDAKRYGMTVVVDEKLPKDVTDLTTFLTKVKAVKPDIMVVSAHTLGGALFVRQMREQQVNVPIVAMTHCEAAKVTDTATFGNAGEGILCAAQWSEKLNYSDKWFGTAANYAKTFEAEFGYVPPYQAAESSAAVLVYADAIERAGSLDTEKIRDALAATEMQTFYGNIKFAPTGQNTAKPMVLRQIQNGEYRLVAPLEWADSKFMYPREVMY